MITFRETTNRVFLAFSDLEDVVSTTVSTTCSSGFPSSFSGGVLEDTFFDELTFFGLFRHLYGCFISNFFELFQLLLLNWIAHEVTYF